MGIASDHPLLIVQIIMKNWTSHTQYLTIGHGLDIKPSAIKGHSTRNAGGAGLGCFLTVGVKSGHPITIYDGELVFKHTLPRFSPTVVSGAPLILPVQLTLCYFQMSSPMYAHVMTISKTDYAVLGQAAPIIGRGGGQFVNHARRDIANVKIVAVLPKQGTVRGVWSYLGDDWNPSAGPSPYLVVIAKKDIPAGSELLWCYPSSTVARLGIVDEPEPEVYFPPPADYPAAEIEELYIERFADAPPLLASVDPDTAAATTNPVSTSSRSDPASDSEHSVQIAIISESSETPAGSQIRSLPLLMTTEEMHIEVEDLQDSMKRGVIPLSFLPMKRQREPPDAESDSESEPEREPQPEL